MSFYKSIAKYYDYIFPINKNKLNFIIEKNNAITKQKILDIGCSTGILDNQLAQLGYLVYGIDLDSEMIKIAKNYENDNLKFFNINMLDIDQILISHMFDQVICFGNTLVHLNNLEQILSLFSKIKIILKKEGKFKFQIINYDKILNDKINNLPTIENNKIKFIRNYNYVNGKIKFNTQLTIKNSNKTITNSIDLFPLRKNDLKELLYAANYHNIKYYSDFEKTPFKEDSLRLIIECSN